MTKVQPRITQRYLARLAKLSHTTVSLALRNHPSIPAETRARIAALAERHGYFPDPMLAALNAYRVGGMPSRYHGTLAWLTGFSSADGWRKMIQAEGYFLGAREQAARLGYRLEEFWIREPGLNANRATQVLRARGVQGLLVAPLPEAHGRIELDWSQFSSAVLGYSLAEPQLHLVMNHQFRNMKALVQKLSALGYSRVGLALPSSLDDRVDHNYLAGYWIAQRDFPAKSHRLTPLLAPNFDQATFTRWFRRCKPDAIVTASSLVYHVIGWLKAIGAEVPRDVGISVASVPFGDSNISGIDENVRSVGAMLVDTVVGMLHRNERGPPANPLRILTEGAWAQGKTVRASGNEQRVRKQGA